VRHLNVPRVVCLLLQYLIQSCARGGRLFYYLGLHVCSKKKSIQIKSSESAAADKIRNYRDPYQCNRQVAFLPTCMSTSGRIHGELLRLLFFLSNKQADDYFEVLGYQAHKEDFCHRRGVFFHRNRCTIGMACAQAVALRGAPTTARRHVLVPRGGVGGGRGARRGVSNLPPGHRVADIFRWADRAESA
jgi:hypothetical protein